MIIREILAKDDKAIEQIIKETLESFDLAIEGTAYFDRELKHLSHYYARQPYAAYWVAEKDGRILGGCGIASFNTDKRICELQKLYLMPEAQGQGIAKALMNTALSYAKKYYDHCYLETMLKMDKANGLYRSFGFQKLDKPLDGSVHSVMDVWYVKKLQEDSNEENI
ncbi:GNAT family N-acetyltransferase [Enterococcus wangshanyuanii]|uniref:N-acetyltransferase n=1 Tax=Enterococcus wangshanyuanii TaxID=2005703 RepID=A0ABQ1P8J4_9ENTE|nr:GNAT family N-acetyltransferase [Enterococcus wangshanyuanii]GGC92969.1 N-acetyltransferase [Enterococcus wangshanyuanii]